MRTSCLLLTLLLAACDRAGEPAAEPPPSEPTVAAPAIAAPEPAAAVDQPEAVIDQEFVYGSIDDENLVGYFALPDAISEPPPGVILIHERWGLDDGMRATARRLAADGYAVLAVDLYGGAVATDSAAADALMATVFDDRDAALANLHQAYDYLVNFALAPEVAVLGRCLGGTWALEAGIDFGDQLDAIVMHYGELIDSPDLLQRIDAPLLGIFGAEDERIPTSSVQRFRAQLVELGKESSVVIYPGVGTEFATAQSDAYDAEAAEKAWAESLEFLDSKLKRQR